MSHKKPKTSKTILILTAIVLAATSTLGTARPAAAHHAADCSDVYTPLSNFVVDGAARNKESYIKVMNETGVPWELLAAIHYRETSFSRTNPSNGQGIFQFVNGDGGPYPAGPVSNEEFERQLKFMANKLQNDYVWRGSIPRERRKLQPNEPNIAIVKDTLFSYNGRAGVYANQATHFGYDASVEPFEGSPYVMNRFDCARARMGLITRDFGSMDGIDTRYGAFVVYARLRSESYWQQLWNLYRESKTQVRHIQKSAFGSAHQVFTATENQVYSNAWWPGSEGLHRDVVTRFPIGESIVGFYKVNDQDGKTQNMYVATKTGVYKITWNGNGYSSPAKIVSLSGVRNIYAEVINEGGQETHRLYVLAQDGPYEYWWRDGTAVSSGFRFWNITNAIDLVKSVDAQGRDELYVATTGEVYRMKWPVNGEIEKIKVLSLANTVAIDKQNLPGGTELLYTATKTGVHETWWKPGTGFSNASKIVQAKDGQQVVDVKKTITNGYQQLYVAENGYVREYWWGPNSGGIHSGQLIHITQNSIAEIDKTTSGAYQNLYTASQSFIFETWWGNGRFGNGPAIINLAR